MKRVVSAGLVLVFSCFLLSARRAKAQDIDMLDHKYHQLSNAHRHAATEHLLLKMLDMSPTATWKAASLNRLGLECKNQGRYDDAEKYYLAAYEENIAVDHVNRGWIPQNLSIVYLEQGNLDEAERWNNVARTNWEAGGRSHSTQMATTLTTAGRIQSEKRQFPLAEQYHRSAMSMCQATLGRENEEVTYCMSYLGRAVAEQGKLDEAEKLLNQCVTLQQKLLPKDDPDLAWTKSNLAFIYAQRGDFTKAEPIDRLALEALEKGVTKRDKRLVEAYEYLARDLEKLGRVDEANAMKDKSEEARVVRAALVKGRSTNEVSFEVEVVSNQADIKAVATVIAKAKKGDRFQVDHVDGPWYAVTTQVNGEQKVGYFHYRDISIMNDTGIKNEIRWQELSPAAGRFAVRMPGSAKMSKQTVNGADNYGFEVTVGDSVYLVSYFDLPAGTVLTFDAAIGAYSTARKGQVVSQKAIDKDLFPGREFAVKLPSGQISRMQLIQAGNRWFTLTVEAPQASAYGNDANSFIESFAIKD